MPRSILIVDDNAPFRGMLKSMLKMRGYEAVGASSAATGLKLAADLPIDGVLVDYDMPDTNGLEFCQLLREQNRSTGRTMPVWLMTGTLAPEVGKRADEVGALLVLRKPFNMDEICGQLEREFERGADAPLS